MGREDLIRLQALSRWLCRAVTGVAFMLLLGAALLLVSEFWNGFSTTGGVPARRIASWFVFWAPAAFYLWALWAVRRALRDIAVGRHLRPALARSLRDVGIGLALGAMTSALVQPNLMRLMRDAGWGGHPFASYGHFDVAYIALGAVSLALVLLSRVLRDAAELQAELDEIL